MQGPTRGVGVDAIRDVGDEACAVRPVELDQRHRVIDRKPRAPLAGRPRAAGLVNSSRHPRRSEANRSASGATTQSVAGTCARTARAASGKEAHSGGVRQVDPVSARASASTPPPAATAAARLRYSSVASARPTSTAATGASARK